MSASSKLILAILLAAAAGGAPRVVIAKPHAHKLAATPQHERLVRAPGGVLVPKPAPPGNSPGFMDDGAKKRGEKR